MLVLIRDVFSLWGKVSSSRAARGAQEAEEKVSGWTDARSVDGGQDVCGSFDGFLRITGAGHAASVNSDPSGFLTLGYDWREEMIRHTCSVPDGDPLNSSGRMSNESS